MSAAFLRKYSSRKHKTRHSANAWLRLGFFDYLKAKDKEGISFAEFDGELVKGFERWLNRTSRATSAAVWAVGTRQAFFATFRAIVETLKTLPKWKKLIPPDFSVPTHKWPGASRQRKPTPIILDQDFADLYRACCSEMSSVRASIAIDVRLMEEARHLIPANPTTMRDYKTRGVALAAFDEFFIHGVPSYPALEESHSYLLRAVKTQFGNVVSMRSVLAPSPRDLVPFVLMLAIHTRLNPEALLASNQFDFRIEDRLGEKRLVSRVTKGRAWRKQMPGCPVDESVDNPAAIIEFLNSWTARLRRLADPEIAGKLLLFVPTTAFAVPSIFNVQSTNGHNTWAYALRLFCSDHKLAKFTLKQLRPTTLDIGIAIHGGDLRVAQALGDHVSAETTNTHYTSDAQRQRNSERLGEIAALRRRWLDTGGKSDSRNPAGDADEGAVTPGWGCLDPYMSPYSPHDKLCTAFGRCPGCVLTQLDLSSIYACAQALNLLNAVGRARNTMDPQAWMLRMAPIETKLRQFWLPQFSADVFDKARSLNLPPLPTPD